MNNRNLARISLMLENPLKCGKTSQINHYHQSFQVVTPDGTEFTYSGVGH